MAYPVQQLKAFPLFRKIETNHLQAMLTCLGAHVKNADKGQFLALSQDEIRYISVVITGEIQLLHEDRWGDKSVLTRVTPGGLFGESFVCSTDNVSLVTFQAVKKTTYLLLPFHKVLHVCNNSCPFHFQLIENMLALLAEKNQQLMEKLEIISKKKLRKKLLTFFSFQAEQAGSNHFTLPLTRTQLADYVCADRTAVARELSQMKKEGLIDFNNRDFTLK